MTTQLSKADQFASTVAIDLRRAENANVDAAMQLTESISNTLAGRREAGLSTIVGTRALVAASRALHITMEAGAELATAHTLAQRDAKRMGLIYDDLIPTEPKPDDERPPVPTGRLTEA